MISKFKLSTTNNFTNGIEMLNFLKSATLGHYQAKVQVWLQVLWLVVIL